MPAICVTELKYTCLIASKRWYITYLPAVVLTVGIAVLSLMESPYVPEALTGKDKVLHGAMYGVLAVAWLVPIASRRSWRTCLNVWMAVTVYGALMEVLQRYCTLTRSGEMADLYADAIGAMVGVTIVFVIASLRRIHKH